MLRLQLRITCHRKNWENFNRQKRKGNQEDADVKIMSDFKAAITQVLQQTVNTHEKMEKQLLQRKIRYKEQ